MPAKGFKKINGKWTRAVTAAASAAATTRLDEDVHVHDDDFGGDETSGDDDVVVYRTRAEDDGEDVHSSSSDDSHIGSIASAAAPRRSARAPKPKKYSDSSESGSSWHRTATSASRSSRAATSSESSASTGGPGTPPPAKRVKSDMAATPAASSSSSTPSSTRAAVVLTPRPAASTSSASASASSSSSSSAPDRVARALVVAESPVPGGRVIFDVTAENKPSVSVLTSAVSGQHRLQAGSFVKLDLAPSSAADRTVPFRRFKPLTEDEIEGFKIGPTSASIMVVGGPGPRVFHVVLAYVVSVGEKRSAPVPGAGTSAGTSVEVPVRTLEVLFRTDDGSDQRLNLTLWQDKADIEFEPGEVVLFDGVFSKRYGGAVSLNGTASLRVLRFDTAQVREYKARFRRVVEQDDEW